MQPPTLARLADRTYVLTLPHNVGGLRAYLEAIGFVHFSPKMGDLFTHRWRSADGKTMISMFPSARIVCLGASHVLDELVEATAEVQHG
jgi:hypothetical protein